MLTITAIGTNVAMMSWDDAKIENSLKVLYKVDKKNPIDPTKRFRSGKYYEETFKISLYIGVEEYRRLKLALSEAEDVWLEYELGWWRCEVSKYPTQSWELLDGMDEVELEMTATYKTKETKPSVTHYSVDDNRIS